jgi:glyoxylase-like metal-dependent hydrolase (beta-lactamase superfamily II)
VGVDLPAGAPPVRRRGRRLLGALGRSLHASAFADSVQPVLDAGLVEPVAADTELAAGVHIRRTPVHTHGHLSIWIGDRCVITGDVLHHPIRCRHPEWTARGDLDPDLARATRRALLAASATSSALVLGTHFAGTSAGRVLATGDGYHFLPGMAQGSWRR